MGDMKSHPRSLAPRWTAFPGVPEIKKNTMFTPEAKADPTHILYDAEEQLKKDPRERLFLEKYGKVTRRGSGTAQSQKRRGSLAQATGLEERGRARSEMYNVRVLLQN